MACPARRKRLGVRGREASKTVKRILVRKLPLLCFTQRRPKRVPLTSLRLVHYFVLAEERSADVQGSDGALPPSLPPRCVCVRGRHPSPTHAHTHAHLLLVFSYSLAPPTVLPPEHYNSRTSPSPTALRDRLAPRHTHQETQNRASQCTIKRTRATGTTGFGRIKQPHHARSARERERGACRTAGGPGGTWRASMHVCKGGGRGRHQKEITTHKGKKIAEQNNRKRERCGGI